ncbi:MAG: 23S rRNA (pseudouridine(1915)-N(3))-methyltransferase RlmH [Alphaproteobacteria bacterium]|nr:23S rRNA (pseudouridine(1915)-N(3))-methyltransferase RlmH [Alphaproteobacteria bacterium]
MRLLIAAIGKLSKKSPEQTLIDDYLKKARWPVIVKEFEEKKKLPDSELKEAESRLLWSAVPPGAKVVVLDERGKEPSSRELATQICRWRDSGIQDIAFLIGGANGHPKSTRDRADFVLSFGRMTMPHFLARVVLAEQIYRIKTILDGHPYHRD